MGDVATRPRTRTRLKTERPRLHKVILVNDDYTPREFVVTVLKAEFRMNQDQAYRVMMTAHRRGACVVAEAHVHGLLRLGPAVSAHDAPPEQVIARALTAASTAPRAFLDRGAWIVEHARAARADAVILWLTREDEALAWQLPAMRRALQDAGILTLELAATQWLAPAAVLARITAFCRETGR